VSSPNLLPSIYLPSLLYPHHPSNGMSSVLNSQKHPTVIHMQHLYKINQLHGIRLLLQKLTVAHLLKEFPTFHENEISLLNHINPAYRSMMMECNWLDKYFGHLHNLTFVTKTHSFGQFLCFNHDAAVSAVLCKAHYRELLPISRSKDRNWLHVKGPNQQITVFIWWWRKK
jgi:hypothetical protein